MFLIVHMEYDYGELAELKTHEAVVHSVSELNNVE